mmetsp:Transcript_1374/g.4829  ORF Transcript_1374/g.4829 Transcript_1374/m.4829 type:complete len:242 (+) Transcript_1374:277-1002(+)
MGLKTTWLAVGRDFIPGHCSSVGVPRASKIRESCSRSLLPGSQGRLSMSSAKTQPTAHMSTAEEYSWESNRSSGARYHRAKTWVVNFLSLGDPKTLPAPKSASLTWPDGPSRMLFGFTSLCMIQCPWHAASPCRIALMYAFTSASLSRRLALSLITASRSLVMYSYTKYRFRLCGKTSISSITFSCCSSLKNLISRIAVTFTPSLAFPILIFLMATRLPVRLSVAAKTRPKVPSPRVGPFS